jgi:hypothetical protein
MTTGDFHAGFVGLNGDQGLLRLDHIAYFYQQLNHFNFFEVTNVGNFDFNLAHVLAP